MTKLFITVKGMDFTIFQDRTRTQNLISPAFLSFFREDRPLDGEERLADQRAAETVSRSGKEAFPILPPRLKADCFKDVFKVAGRGVAWCSDNKPRWCRAVRFCFEYNGRAHEELFYIDKSLCGTALLGKCFI